VLTLTFSFLVMSTQDAIRKGDEKRANKYRNKRNLARKAKNWTIAVSIQPTKEARVLVLKQIIETMEKM